MLYVNFGLTEPIKKSGGFVQTAVMSGNLAFMSEMLTADARRVLVKL